MAIESRYLSDFFDTLNAKRIGYCVMNNYMDYPDIIPSDVDITVDALSFDGMDQVIHDFAGKHELLVVQKIWHGYQKCAYILAPGHLDCRFRLQLDFFVDFTAKGYWLLLSHDEMMTGVRNYKNFYVPSPSVEGIFLIMRRIIKNDLNPSKLNEIRKVLAPNKGAISSQPSIQNLVVDYLSLSPDELVTNNTRHKSVLREYSAEQSPLLYKLRYLASQFPRYYQRIKYPVGLCICLIGPDGSGKSTLIKSIISSLDGTFHGFDVRYWRPGFLPRPGALKFWDPSPEPVDNPNPHGHAAQHPLKALLRFFYYLMDFSLGYWVKAWPLMVKKNMVIYDRYYYDIMADMYRYRFSFPHSLVRFCQYFVPSPHMVFVLDCPSSVLLARKQELPADELERQRGEYRKMARSLRSAILIDASKDTLDVLDQITSAVQAKKAQIVRKTLKVKTVDH